MSRKSIGSVQLTLTRFQGAYDGLRTGGRDAGQLVRQGHAKTEMLEVSLQSLSSSRNKANKPVAQGRELGRHQLSPKDQTGASCLAGSYTPPCMSAISSDFLLRHSSSCIQLTLRIVAQLDHIRSGTSDGESLIDRRDCQRGDTRVEGRDLRFNVDVGGEHFGERPSWVGLVLEGDRDRV